MKKVIAILLVLILAFSVTTSFAEEETTGGFFGTIGNFFTNTWNDASKWVAGAWKDATSWIDGAWGDASKWVSQAWNDSSTWVVDIWGEASGWVTDTVGTWWANTFDTVTEDNENKWAWIQEEAEHLKSFGTEIVENAKTVITDNNDGTVENIKTTIGTLLNKMGINDQDSGKVWDTITSYAEQKGISSVSVAKLSVPYLLKLGADSADQSNGGSIPAVAIAQYLTGIIEKLGVNDEAMANELISQLSDVFAGI